MFRKNGEGTSATQKDWQKAKSNVILGFMKADSAAKKCCPEKKVETASVCWDLSVLFVQVSSLYSRAKVTLFMCPILGF